MFQVYQFMHLLEFRVQLTFEIRGLRGFSRSVQRP